MSDEKPAASRTSHRVVVAMMDRKRARGFVYNFSPLATSFYLFPSEAEDAKFASLVELKDVKAIFFVHTHEGNKARREAQRKAPLDPKKSRVRGHRMKITFADGEEMIAATENYNPSRLGFFAYPLEADSNNLRIFIVNANVGQVTSGNAIASTGRPPEVQDRMLRTEAAGPGVAPTPLADTCQTPVDERVEAVLRIIAGEGADEVSDDTGIPTGVLSHWAAQFLQGGRAGLGGSTPDSRDEVIKELAAKVCALEDELDRLNGGPAPRR